MDLGSIAATVESLRTIGSLLKSMSDVRDAALIKAKVMELQDAILSAQSNALTAQSEQFSILQQVRELEARIKELEGWEREKLRYELVQLPSERGFVYSLKKDATPPEPTHMLCVNCFNRGEKSTLQPDKKFVGRAESLVCHNCGAEIYTQGSRMEEHGKVTIKGRR